MKKVFSIAIVGGLGLLLGLAALAWLFQSRQTALLPVAPVHGTAYVLELELKAAGESTNTIPLLKEVMRKRFLKAGLEFYWEPDSPSRVKLAVPTRATNDVEIAKSMMTNGGRIEFRLVHPDSDTLVVDNLGEPGFELLRLPHHDPSRQGSPELLGYLVSKKAELTGACIKDAVVNHDPLGRPQVYFVLNDEATSTFARITKDNVSRHLAIVMDGVLLSAPIIMSPVESGRGLIDGHFTEAKTRELADSLACPLPVPTKIVETTSF